MYSFLSMKREFTPTERHFLNEEIKKRFNFPGHIMESSRVEIIDSLFINIDNQPMWFYFGRYRLAPTIQNLMNYNFLKVIMVDAGATQYLEFGHNIQRAIIKEVDENIKKDEIITVKTHQWDKPICVGLALFDAPEILAQKEGDVIKNLHHVGDLIWQYRHSI